MINVTKTYLPPLKEYTKYLRSIWKNHSVTNNGPLVVDLEERLKKFLGVKHLFLVSNGTFGLQTAIKVLRLKGEIITTPFTYIATASSILWEGCVPVFVDIDEKSLCIDPKKIEAAITKNTVAILPVHVFGNSCDVKAIEKIARKAKLKVIYDAAHAFAVTLNNQSILSFGDISVLSFHATKIFHTIEGGAIITQNDDLAQKIAYHRNFGHNGQEAFFGLGVNGKNTELHAALGLSMLPRLQEIIKQRKRITEEYDKYLKKTSLQFQVRNAQVNYNFAYYPVIFESEGKLLEVRDSLFRRDIFPRRYFYPALSSLDFLNTKSCPIAEDISKRILCLPIYHDLSIQQVQKIVKIIEDGLK